MNCAPRGGGGDLSTGGGFYEKSIRAMTMPGIA